MVSPHREAGAALVFAIVALAIVGLMVALVAASIRPRITSHEHLERTVRLTALADGGLAATLAELATDEAFAGLAERPLGDGVIGSEVRQVGAHEVEVVAVGQTRGWRATVIARVDLEHGPRVMSWRRFQSPE
ncbi:MAG: hypothetical protein MUC56_18725 [Thermoanaerobaculales bacterium]|nr:hypothetical protein [Thermoanaerobaculales bacterium]